MSGIFPNGGVDASQAYPTNLPSIEVTGDGCRALYHNSRCNTRVDPMAVNAIIAEIGNVVNGAGLEYDCSRYDNMLDAVQALIRNNLFDCLPESFPMSGASCSLYYLVEERLTNGCRRIARYSATTSRLGRGTNSSVWGINYPWTEHPINPGDASTYYTLSQLGTAQIQGNINETRLSRDHLVSMQITTPCENTVLRIEITQSVELAPAANGGQGASSAIAIRVDGQFPLSAANLPITGLVFTNFERSALGSTTLTIPTAGNHRLDFYLVANNMYPARAVVLGSTTSTGTDVIVRVDV